jgi:hypothetical protein
VNKPRVASPHQDTCGADRPIPRGIAILIEILVREALNMLMEERAELPAAVTQDKTRLNSVRRLRRDSRQRERKLALKRAKTGQSKIADVIKIKSCLRQNSRKTDLIKQNQIDTKIKSVLLVAGVGFEPTTFGL